jgi:hypothetical protein
MNKKHTFIQNMIQRTVTQDLFLFFKSVLDHDCVDVLYTYSNMFRVDFESFEDFLNNSQCVKFHNVCTPSTQSFSL